jgi:hypothetical protein
MVFLDNTGPCNLGGFAALVLLFHLPGIAIARVLFENYDPAATVFIILSGIVQFQLLAWLVLRVCKKISDKCPGSGWQKGTLALAK